MRRFILILLFLVVIIGMLNIPRATLAMMIFTNDPHCKKVNFHYSSALPNGFSVWSRKGFDDVAEQFSRYSTVNPSDTILYRNFPMEYGKVWLWRTYIFEDSYRLPYKELPADAHLVSRGMDW